MDTYSNCLYDHIMGRPLLSGRRDVTEYRLRSGEPDRAGEEPRKVLTAERLRFLEDYQTAKARVCALEDEWLFRETVSLGRWMAAEGGGPYRECRRLP